MNCSKARHVCLVMGLVGMSVGARTAFGQLLVSDRVTNGILQFGLDGTFQKQLIGPANSASTSDLDGPAAMALGNGNDLFVASQNTGEVLRFNRQTGQFLGDFATGIYGPGGLLFDPTSNVLFVSEFGNFDGETIARFNATTGAPLGRIGVGTGATGRAGMAMGPDGLLYVSSFYDGRVLRFNPTTGAPAGIIPTDPTATFAGGSGGFLGANAIVFDRSGKLDVVGLLSFDVFQFGSSGAPLGELVPAANGGLTYPCALLIGADGNLLVSSLGNNNPSDHSVPLGPGYIGEYSLTTGAAINSFFIDGAGGLTQPTAMLLMPTPEPSTLALALVGGLGCWTWVVRRRRLGV
jgi:hypothetical protein